MNSLFPALLYTIGIVCGGMHTYSVFSLQVGVEVGHQEGGHICFPVKHSLMEGSSTKLRCKRSTQPG